MTLDTRTIIGILLLTTFIGACAVYSETPEEKEGDGASAETVSRELSIDPGALSARAAVVYDPVTGEVLFAKNAEEQLPLASLTKLATAFVALSQGENRLLTLSKEDLAPEGDSGLRPGDTWRLSDLMAFGLTSSSNDAMAAAASIFPEEQAIEQMNTEAKKLGLAQTYFLNPTGLDVSSTTAGAYGSALDVAKLTTVLLDTYPDVFEATTREPTPQGKSGEGATSTLTPIWDMPGLMAAKTGFTDLAGGNLTAVVDLGLNEPVVAVVLGSTIEGRFADVRMLIHALRTQPSL